MLVHPCGRFVNEKHISSTDILITAMVQNKVSVNETNSSLEKGDSCVCKAFINAYHNLTTLLKVGGWKFLAYC